MSLHAKNKRLLVYVQDIIEDYRQSDIKLTLRQLYYQMVAKNYIPNNYNSYLRFATLMRYAREKKLSWLELFIRQVESL